MVIHSSNEPRAPKLKSTYSTEGSLKSAPIGVRQLGTPGIPALEISRQSPFWVEDRGPGCDDCRPRNTTDRHPLYPSDLKATRPSLLSHHLGTL